MTASIVVRHTPNGTVNRPSVAVAPTGVAVIAWQDDADGNGHAQILLRGFRADDVPLGEAETVNKQSAGDQTAPSIAVTSALTSRGTRLRWVVSWTDDFDGNGVTQILGKGGSFFFPLRVRPANGGASTSEAMFHVMGGPARR